MLKKSKIIIIIIILIALIISILSVYLFNLPIEYDNTKNTITTNANVANELYINSNNSTIFNPDISNQIATNTTNNEQISSKTETLNSIISESKNESIPISTNEQKQKTDVKNHSTTNKNSNNPTSNSKSNNDNSNNKTVSTKTETQETQPNQNTQNTTVKKEDNDTSHLANKTYTKPNTTIVPEIISILQDEISKHKELVDYGTKAVAGKKADAYKNTTGFTYVFVDKNQKFTQRVRNNVGAFGTYYVYAEDEYTYNSSGKNPKWSQTLVWIWVSF